MTLAQIIAVSAVLGVLGWIVVRLIQEERAQRRWWREQQEKARASSREWKE